MKSLAGHLLVASRHLRDPNFRQGVVLMLEHGSQGALGVLLNRVSNRTIREVWDALEGPPCDNDQLIFTGGPVPGPLITLHGSEELAEKEILPGVYMSMQRDVVDKLVRQKGVPLRVYNGNSGWGNGQLEGELAVGGWLVEPGTADDVFGDWQTLWRRVTQRVGLRIMLPRQLLARMPDDPSLN